MRLESKAVLLNTIAESDQHQDMVQVTVPKLRKPRVIAYDNPGDNPGALDSEGESSIVNVK